MKIGIMTLHSSHNFGAMLQAYALRHTLQDLGTDAQFVNYQCRTDAEGYQPPTAPTRKDLRNPLRFGKQAVNYFLQKQFSEFNKETWTLFDRFMKYQLEVDAAVIKHPFQLLDADYGAYVCGSDQIWNPDVVKGLRRGYFADIDHRTRRIAYAASMGDIRTAERCAHFLKNEIQKMHFVAVREQDLQHYVRNEVGVEAEWVLDPTLLLTKDVYEQIKINPTCEKPYVLTYNIKGIPNAVSRNAISVAKRKKLPVLELSGKRSFPSQPGYERIQSAGPSEFIGWIAGADTIVTDSFHGVAFSIIYRKNFYYVPQGRTQRVMSLLSMLGLENRAIRGKDLPKQETIDYASVERVLNQYREHSRMFLQRALDAPLPTISKETSYLQTNDKKDCYGCGTCLAVCPVQAITMLPDETGFLYPVIDTERCINCRLCEQRCPLGTQQSFYPVRNTLPHAYAAVHADKHERMKSSSGGMYAALSDCILDNGGAVFGAVYDENLQVTHRMAETKTDRDKQRKSKYVQSNAFVVFPQVREQLENGRMVLFSGTSCQVAGLYNYLDHDYGNLYTCDLLCVGASSPKLYHAYLNQLGKRYGTISEIDFRHKNERSRKVGRTCLRICTEGGKVIEGTPESESFLRIQDTFTALRPSCHRCEYASPIRPADITIGDFRNPSGKKQNVDDSVGTSAVYLQTKKGKELFDLLLQSGSIETAPLKLDATICTGSEERRYAKQSEKAFWELFFDAGYEAVAKKYGGCTRTNKLKYHLKKWLKVGG